MKGELFFHNELIITRNGLVNGLRKKNDGQTFFGILNEKDYTDTYYSDYIINISLKGDNNNNITSSTGRIFNIYYSKITNDYFLHLMNNNYNISYLIENNYYFTNNKDTFIIIGKCLLTINQKEITNNKKKINIKVDYDDNNSIGKQYNFTEEDSPITIGRKNDNKIFISNLSISKEHGVIMFSEENKNFYYKDLNSTNGSMLFMREDDTLKIKGEMRCKLNDTYFNILEIP